MPSLNLQTRFHWSDGKSTTAHLRFVHSDHYHVDEAGDSVVFPMTEEVAGKNEDGSQRPWVVRHEVP